MTIAKKILTTCTPEQLIIVSNIKSGELKNVESLGRTMLPPTGQKVPLLVFQVADDLKVIYAALKERGVELEDLLVELKDLDKETEKTDYEELERMIEGVRANIKLMEQDLEILEEVEDPENTYRIVDGHRRFTAGVFIGLSSFDIIIHPAEADPSKVITDQMILGMQQETLSKLDEARTYRNLRSLGKTQDEIIKDTGNAVKRSTILQRGKILDVYERVEQFPQANEEASVFLDAIDNDSFKVQILTKMGQYLEEDDVADSGWLWMIELANTGVSGENFATQCNDKFGAKAGPTSTAKSTEEGGIKTAGGVRKRNASEIEKTCKFWQNLATAGLENRAEKGDACNISKIDQARVEYAALQAECDLGGEEPPVPESFKKAAEYMKKQEKAAEVKDKEAKAALKTEASKEKKEAASAEKEKKKLIIDEFKNLYKLDVKAVETTIKANNAKITKLNEKITTEKDETKLKRATGELEKAVNMQLVLDKKLASAKESHEASKPEWLKEDEAKKEKARIEREAKKADEALEAASKPVVVEAPEAPEAPVE